MSKIEKIVKSDKTNRTALVTVLAAQKKRIFNDGKDANGSQIGKYSTNTISISKKNQARNTGKTYFKGGYDEYKSAVGKNPGFVNLRNTDQMMMDYSLIVSGDDYGLGFQNEENYNKSQWMEEKYKKPIFEPSDEEIDLHARVLTATVEAQL